MIVFVRFAPGVRNDIFEGTRLRKNIKGGLELNNIKWVESVFAGPDVCHYLTPVDEGKAHDAKLDNYPIVVSALYAENDPYCRYLERGTDSFYALSPRAIKLLEMADLVLVPSLSAKNLLFQCGLQNSAIEIVTPGVNVTRFEILDPLEGEVFHRYFRLSKDDRYVISVGDFEDQRTIKKLRTLAEAMPKLLFFFFGSTSKTGDGIIKKLSKDSPPNIRFHPVVEDDVFRSGLFSALYFLELGESLSHPLEELEAMAAKTPIIHIGKPMGGDFLKDGINCLAPLDVEEAAKMLDSLSTSDTEAIIIEGYKTAKENTLGVLGEKLKGIYASLLNKTEED